MAHLYLREELAAAWRGQDPFVVAAGLEGEVFRAMDGRRTLRVEIEEQFYFLKYHEGVGWREIGKNLLTLRWPVLGAANEYRACRTLAAADIAAPGVAAFGARGLNPARRQSFVLLDAIEPAVSLETLTQGWMERVPDPPLARELVMAVADFARRFHAAGLVHRDFYICHFLVEAPALARGEVRLHIIDLHRARGYRRLPLRWRRRDLAALLYSVMDLPLSRRSWLRFVRCYTGRPLQQVFARDAAFWSSVYQRALRLYRKGERKGLVQGRFWQ